MHIVFLDTDTVGDLAELRLLEQFGKFTLYPYTAATETIERIKDAEIVITNKVILDRKIIEASSALKLICVAATGTNNIDLKAAEERGIPVKNVKGYSTDSVAQHTFALIFHLLNHLYYYDTYVKSGIYSNSQLFTNLKKEITELKGKTLGIIGFGAIGQRVAQLAEVFGAKIIYYSTSGKNNNRNYRRLPLHELLAESDIVSIHAPLNDNTKYLIGYNELELMKRHALLVNTGRGGIVHEGDLARALNETMIQAAALDVFEKEPLPADNPLLTVKEPGRLLLTPHVAWSAREARQELLWQIAEHIKEYATLKNN